MIQEFLEFKAMAAVLGDVREVEFAEGELSISGLSAKQALDILAVLGGEKLAPQTAPVAAKEKREYRPPAVTTTQTSQPEAEKVKPLPVTVEDPLEFPPKDSLPYVKPEEAAQPSAPASPPIPAEHTTGLPTRVLEAKRFSEVFAYVMETSGLTVNDRDKLVAACEALKEHVPVVRRTRDIGERVDMSLLAWKESGRA